MTIIAANEARQRFGKVLVSAQREPVLFEKHNRPVAVILSPQEYERLRGNGAEFAAFCDKIGTRAGKRGLTAEKLTGMLDDE